ncbi:MAG: glycosyltransferase family 4 protein [Acidimicrobiia bacterium]
MATQQRGEILFVAVPGMLGGSNRSLATLITALRPYVRCVLASPETGSFREFCLERNVADEYLSLPSGSRAKRILAALMLSVWIIRRRRRLTSIHAQALTGLNVVAPAAALARLPVVVRVSDPEGSRWGRLFGPLWRRMLPKLVVVPVSEIGLEAAVANGLCSLTEGHIVPNPVEPLDVVAQERQGGDDLVVGFLGGPSLRKGFDLIPAVVSNVASSVSWKLFTPARATHVPLEVLTALEKQYPVVQFVGREVDVRRVYSQTDIVFVPSRAESFSRVVAESMLNGIPVVASDILPHRLLLGEDEAGLLFRSEDPLGAAVAIDNLASDPELRARLGAMGRVRAAAYEPDGIARRLLPLYGITV